MIVRVADGNPRYVLRAGENWFAVVVLILPYAFAILVVIMCLTGLVPEFSCALVCVAS